MKKNSVEFKKIYKNDIIAIVKNDYKEFEISDTVYNNLYNNIFIDDLNCDCDDNIYYNLLYFYKLRIENYIMNECRDNLLYQILLAEMKEMVVLRYLSLKKLNSYKNSVSDISFSIMEELINNYDINESLNNQYVKKLNKKFNKV